MTSASLGSKSRFLLLLTTTATEINHHPPLACARLLSSNSFLNDPCPFQVLGVERNGPYDTVKKAFVKLALLHHPDVAMAKHNTPRTRQNSSSTDDHDTFLRIRRAFETIQNENGQAVYRQTRTSTGNEGHWTDESLATWFQQQTGRHLSFHMDSSTRRQVAAVANTMAPGGLDKGGMWELAQSVARQENQTGNVMDPLAISTESSCDTSSPSPSSTRRARRKRK